MVTQSRRGSEGKGRTGQPCESLGRGVSAAVRGAHTGREGKAAKGTSSIERPQAP